MDHIIIRTAIFASGSGTNAENIIRHFKGHSFIETALVLCNKPGAGVLERAEKLGVETLLFNRDDLYENSLVLRVLEEKKIDFIVLAGFLWMIPKDILMKFPGRIVNIHPALLPKYGGKGMYGEKVHQAVRDHMEKKTGITIHHVNEIYDAGDIIFQAECEIDPVLDSPEEIASRVHKLEYQFYPIIIEKTIRDTLY